MRGAPPRQPGSKLGAGTPGPQHAMHLADTDLDENGARLMSRKVVQQVLRSSGSFVTPQYNTTLYLNSMMFSSIQGLEDFTGLKVLHLECNAIKKIQGLQHMTQLKALYLQSNDISHLEGLEACTQLEHLNISGNPVLVLDGLPPSLGTLHASSVGLSSEEQISRLSDMCPALQVLDVSRNRLPASALPMLCKLLQLRVLYCKDNPCTQAPSYRRRLVSSLPQLSYLDDSPIDDMERRGAEAWVVGGNAAEREARLACREERRRALRRSTTTFAVERAQRRILRELSGLVGSDEQLSLLLQMLDSPLQQDSVQALVSQIMGEQHPATVLPEALDVLPTGQYQRDGPPLLLAAPHTPVAEGPGAPSEAAGPHPEPQQPLTGYPEEVNRPPAPGRGVPSSVEECVVCSEELEDGVPVMWLPCSHVFHEACIRQWLTGFSSTCPTCRAKVLAAPASPAAHPATNPGPQQVDEAAAVGSSLGAEHTAAAAAAAALVSEDEAPSPLAASSELLAAALGDRVGPAGQPLAPAPASSALTANRITLSILAELAASLASPRLPSAPGPHSSEGEPPAAPGPGPTPMTVLAALAAAAQAAASPPSTADASNPVPCTPGAGASISSPAPDPSASTEESSVPAAAGCAQANTMEDPTYQKLQHMYRHNFGQRSKAAESLLGGWNSIKESRRKELEGSLQQPEGEAALASGCPSTEVLIGMPLKGTEGRSVAGSTPEMSGGSTDDAPTAATVRDLVVDDVACEGSQAQAGGEAQQQQQPYEAAAAPLAQCGGGMGSGKGDGVPCGPSGNQAPGAAAASSMQGRVRSTRPEPARAAVPAAVPAWKREVCDSPVQSVLQAVSRVMQQRHGQAPSADAASLAGALREPSHAPSSASSAPGLGALGEQRPGRLPQKKLGPSLSIGHLVASEGLVLGDEDPWALPALEAPSVPYL